MPWMERTHCNVGDRTFCLVNESVPDIWALPGCIHDGNLDTVLGYSVRTINTEQLKAYAANIRAKFYINKERVFV